MSLEQVECVICLETIPTEEYMTANHGTIKHPIGYHIHCWHSYRIKQNTCPYCREILSPIYNALSPYTHTTYPFLVSDTVRENELQHYLDQAHFQQIFFVEIGMFATLIGNASMQGLLNNSFFTDIATVSVSFYMTCRTVKVAIFIHPILFATLFYAIYAFIEYGIIGYCLFVEQLCSIANNEIY